MYFSKRMRRVVSNSSIRLYNESFYYHHHPTMTMRLSKKLLEWVEYNVFVRIEDEPLGAMKVTGNGTQLFVPVLHIIDKYFDHNKTDKTQVWLDAVMFAAMAGMIWDSDIDMMQKLHPVFSAITVELTKIDSQEKSSQ